ncbi:MAG: hypothetical protein CMG61_02865 [Candidatus Marinimicrobia bacterium]|nr:hypothetical protein [Candidatus Neomarinimicrobiota bacterium]|tara:strand:- start:14008 stop:15099 length:1092 start_codon:yes stop_codon:yes gene_type:complete
MKNLRIRLFSYILFVSPIIALSDFSINNSFGIGYDSNPLRLSNNEINQIPANSSILKNAKYVHSRFFNFKSVLKFKSKSILPRIDKKTLYTISFSGKIHNDNQDKSVSSLGIQIDNLLGKYRHFYINYFFMPDFYLREYKDGDLVVDNSSIEDNLQSAKFSISKLSFAYSEKSSPQFPKLKFGISYERQLFDKFFTEFDLNITGFFSQINFRLNDSITIFDDWTNIVQKEIMLYFSHEIADNFTYLNGQLTTLNDDRSYNQSRIKFIYKELVDTLPFVDKVRRIYQIDSYFRYNTSNIISDELHYGRSHNDVTFTYSLKFDNHKISFSKRNRVTKSPQSWVENLKSFKRYIISYTFYFDKIKL